MENGKRLNQIYELLRCFGIPQQSQITPLNTDASSRRYWRAAYKNHGSVIVLDDENKCCKTKEFAELSSFLRAHGAYVPEVFAQNIDEGLLILEDLGNDSINSLLTPENEKELYLKSAQALAKVAKITLRPQNVKDFAKADLLKDIKLFSDWYVPMVLGHPLNTKAYKEFFAIVDELADMAFKVPNRLMLWDYHVDNIMLPPHSRECAIIDFQDAMWGPLTYDLASLLASDRRVVSPSTTNAVKVAFWQSMEGINQSVFNDSLAFMSMYRHMRVLGRFTTLCFVNRKEKYLNYIPQTWQHLEEDLDSPVLQKMKDWVNKNIPADHRGLPHKKPLNSAIILAAGRGSRMEHLTDDMPKPLVKVGNKSLIDYNLERILSAGISDITVNLCYKGEMIKKHLHQVYPDIKITFSEEETALETGGGIKKALPLIKSEAFFVCNSDVFFIDEGYKPLLWRMMDEWDEKKYDILLMLQDVDKICGDVSGDYRLDSNNNPERNALKLPGYPYMFGGISVISRKIFADEKREIFSLRDMFDKAQSQGRLGFVINNGCFFHVGTPQALNEAVKKISGYK